MSKRWAVVLGCLCAGAIHGQSVDSTTTLAGPDTTGLNAIDSLVRTPGPSNPYPLPGTGLSLSMELRGGYDSNALLNALVMGIWRGEELDRDMRERTRDELTGDNRAGYEAIGSLDLSWGKQLFGDTRLRPMVSIASRSVMGMRFTDAVYDLTFFGNKEYVGATAVLAPSAQEQQRYQTLGFGVKVAGRETYARIDLVNGQYLSSVHLDKADLYTAPDGEYLEADLDGTWLSSDTGTTAGYSNGFGAALDLGLELRGLLNDRPLTTKLRVDDLGLIRWNEGAMGLTKQEVIRYDGLTIDDILDFDGTFYSDGQLRDSLALDAVEGSFTRWMPARLQAAFWYSFGPGTDKERPGPATLTLDQLIIPGYLPHVTLAHAFDLSRQLSLSGSMAYGGFGGLRFGLGAWLQLPNGVLWVDAPNIVGLVSPDAKGKALSLGFAYGL